MLFCNKKVKGGEAYKRPSEILISSFKRRGGVFSRSKAAHMAGVFFRVPEDSNLWAERPRAKPRALCAERSSRGFPGLAARGIGPSSARRWAQPAGSPNDPPPPAAARPRLPLVPGTCPTRRCFQHSRRELSRSSTPGKYLFRDLAPAEEEIAATLEPSGRRGLVVCLPLQIASEARGLPSGARPRNPTPDTGRLWG